MSLKGIKNMKVQICYHNFNCVMFNRQSAEVSVKKAHFIKTTEKQDRFAKIIM